MILFLIIHYRRLNSIKMLFYYTFFNTNATLLCKNKLFSQTQAYDDFALSH
jgi:hypothetical protein